MRRWLSAVFIVFCLAWVLGKQVSVSSAASSPSEVIDTVNALRAGQGLKPLQPNSALMAAAQGHSDYMAAAQTVTHSGQDGSQPKDRAAAAGYKGGFVAENIYAGRNATAQTVVTWWTSDIPHWTTMMEVNSTDIGAGVAEADSVVYYTIDVGSPSGYAAAVQDPTSVGSTPQPTEIPIQPLVTSTPNADGSVIHVVQWGQTLITIAQAYNLSVTELKALNHLSVDTITVGQKLVIKAVVPPTITATAILTVKSSPTRTATRRSPTLIPTATPSTTPTQTLTPTPASILNSIHLDRQTMGYGLIAICGLGLVLVVIVSFRKTK
ncbi:MAG TPA: CAP domain-containing protein [Anaerolineaceae bacterium]|nr:CAP domain-containing protein [Anaerolineaceae bacterium]